MVHEEYAEPESFARLLSSIDAAWIEEALEATGAATIRRRRLPAEQVVWLVLGMALYRGWSISRVVSHLHLALPGESGRGVVPSAPVQARARLGDEAMRWLFERCAQTWAHQSADRYRYRGLALYGVDGTTVRTLDSADNRAHFGGQSSGDRGDSGYPQARVVTLMALRSHLLAAARFAPYAVGETTLAAELWPQVPDDSLCIVDRGFLAAGCLLALEDQSKNRHWMTRAKTTSRWRTIKRLGKGDELVELEFSDQTRRVHDDMPERWLVRAVRYERKGFKPQTLLTSLVDHKRFPMRELVALYHERWELELGFDEVKTELLDREEALRSKTPRGVAQELWSLGLLYNLIRLEMEQIAAEAGVPPTRISFIAALQFIQNCWLICAAMAPARIPRRLRKLREDLSQFILPPRRSERLYPRAVKIKMSPYPKKRSKPAPLGWKKAYLTTAK
jgi:Insertion element 4 transposase N-terminal/Transposase DDE domain